MVSLDILLEHVPYRLLQGTMRQNVAAVSIHSQEVERGTLFVCLKGERADGHRYIPQVFSKGASAILVQEEADYSDYQGLTVIWTPDTRAALSSVSHAFYDHPAKKLLTVAITGTKGKTTTACMILSVLRRCGINAGYIGTLGIDSGDGMEAGDNTTPESIYVARALARMVEKNCRVVVMEASSQGLKMHRLDEIIFDIGVYMNLSNDHIGPQEHKDMAEYAACKAMLFRQCRTGIFNLSDSYTDYMVRRSTCSERMYFAAVPLHRRADDKAGMPDDRDIYTAENLYRIRSGHILGSRFLMPRFSREPFEIAIPGTCNVENALAAAVVCRKLKLSPAQIRAGLKCASVPGRMENVSFDDSYSIFIDYAHNALALSHILCSLREYRPQRLVCLFGCGGNRARDRRYEMGETSGKLADLSIVTSDNPRYEDPDAIIEDILVGMHKTDGHFVRITDRREAIAYALSHAAAGDILLLAGKGHETYQEINGRKYPMDEREILREQRMQ